MCPVTLSNYFQKCNNETVDRFSHKIRASFSLQRLLELMLAMLSIQRVNSAHLPRICRTNTVINTNLFRNALTYKLLLRHVSASILSHLQGACGFFFPKQAAHIEKKKYHQLPEDGQELRPKHVGK